MRGFKTLTGGRLICWAHAFLRNLRRHSSSFSEAVVPATMEDALSRWHVQDRLAGKR